MKILLRWLILLFFCCSNTVVASQLRGYFAGTVLSGGGIVDGVNFSEFSGNALVGSFEFEIPDFQVTAGDSITWAWWEGRVSGRFPGSMTQIVGGRTYSLSADQGAWINIYRNYVPVGDTYAVPQNSLAFQLVSYAYGRANTMLIGYPFAPAFTSSVNSLESIDFYAGPSNNQNITNFTSGGYIFQLDYLRVLAVPVSQPSTVVLFLAAILVWFFSLRFSYVLRVFNYALSFRDIRWTLPGHF